LLSSIQGGAKWGRHQQQGNSNSNSNSNSSNSSNSNSSNSNNSKSKSNSNSNSNSNYDSNYDSNSNGSNSEKNNKKKMMVMVTEKKKITGLRKPQSMITATANTPISKTHVTIFRTHLPLLMSLSSRRVATEAGSDRHVTTMEMAAARTASIPMCRPSLGSISALSGCIP